MAQSRLQLMRFVPAIGWAGVIFYLSHQSGRDIGLDPFVQEIIAIGAHAVEFGMLTILILWAVRFKTTKKTTSIILFGVLLFALSDEWHQSFVPGRTPTLFDIGVDMLASAGVMRLNQAFSQNLANKKTPESK